MSLSPIPRLNALTQRGGLISSEFDEWLREVAAAIDGPPAGVTFAQLPSPPAAGMTAYVTDSNTAVWGATIAGGGANAVLAWYNGTNWTVYAK